MGSWKFLNLVRQRVRAEKGILRKESSLRVALCHPAPYPVAMSSLGFQTIYREICRHPGAAAERAFLPDNVDEYRKTRTPVFSYESETPLANFPIIAFSIAYELELPGIFDVLDLSGIPPLTRDRTGAHPLIVVGGPLTYSNPDILYPFADIVILGEGEEIIHTLLDAAESLGRVDLLSLFSATPGCYVPGLTQGPPSLARVNDALLPACSQILTGDTVLTSMFLVEAERGCSRACTFCVMRCTTNGGMRLVSPDKVVTSIPADARRVGLVGAAVTDHPSIVDLIRSVVSSGREIGVSSLRADRLNVEMVSLLAQGGYRTLTTAADGISQRMRDATRRGVTEQHLFEAAQMARGAGLRRMKLYQMLGLPGESMEDVEELIRFSLELSKIVPLTLSVSPFVAKKKTPLQGAPFEPIPWQMAKIARIREGLRGRVEIKPTSLRWAWVEYMLSQGNETAGLAAFEAWKAGGSFSSWKRAFAAIGNDREDLSDLHDRR